MAQRAAQRVVTGAPNLFVFRGQSLADGTLPAVKVAFARAGAVLVDAYSDATPRPNKKLKPSKIRGVESAGMVCSERELGLSEEHEGIILLPEDAPVGVPLRRVSGRHGVGHRTDARHGALSEHHRHGARGRGADGRRAASARRRVDRPSGDDTAADYVAVRIDEPELCNRYTGTMIVDVTIGASPSWMQDRLRKAGMRPISNVVDITNYVMLEWGQPLHAFDYDILDERAKRTGDDTPTIIVRRAGDGEKFTTLDNVERTLDESMLMITDTAGSVALAGVMGGLESEVSDTTRTFCWNRRPSRASTTGAPGRSCGSLARQAIVLPAAFRQRSTRWQDGRRPS